MKHISGTLMDPTGDDTYEILRHVMSGAYKILKNVDGFDSRAVEYDGCE
jgi:hypothetical protein